MLKKFFVALIVGLLVMNTQIAAAEDYDWSQAPRIGTKDEFVRYVENERRKGNTTFHVILTAQRLKGEELGYIIPCLDVNGTCNYMYDGTTRINCTITEYPGTRVANAYLRGDRNGLTQEELQLYNAAVEIVNAARKYSTPTDRARYLHDEVLKRTIFEEGRETAIDALVCGKANCEGYADSFYMLGRMAGLNVGRIGGYINDGATGHAWNWLELNGKAYCVDVTLDDIFYSYDWFKATKERMQKTHQCDWAVIPNLQ